jgi:hypothetical protein
MRIAIIDVLNQDIGIKILFPEAEYFVIHDEFNKDEALEKYKINKRYDIENINDQTFDCVFIIVSLLNTVHSWHRESISTGYDRVLKMIESNTFKTVCLFDNFDYDYDPSLYSKTDKINVYFKRNYNRNMNYKPNVYPFNFFMFGYYSLIELIDRKRIDNPNRVDRVYFNGSLFNHVDDTWKVYRNRNILYNQLYFYLYPRGYMNKTDFDTYLDEIHQSRFSLDLNGVGDPNKRTFEILSQGSLRISEYNPLKWCFDEEFSEETVFKTADEFKVKIEKLRSDPELYDKCLRKQNEIVEKYYNKIYLRNYILDKLNLG